MAIPIYTVAQFMEDVNSYMGSGINTEMSALCPFGWHLDLWAGLWIRCDGQKYFPLCHYNVCDML